MPEEERPPVLISFYADGLDRDVPTHSSGNNKLHCTYINVLNLCAFGCRSRYNYELVMLLHEATLAKYGYNRCHKKLIFQISTLVKQGIVINGQKHAVRVAYLQVIDLFPYTAVTV